jgi:hypothetical protein
MENTPKEEGESAPVEKEAVKETTTVAVEETPMVQTPADIVVEVIEEASAAPTALIEAPTTAALVRAVPIDSLEAYEAQIAKFRALLKGCQSKHNLVLYALQDEDILHEPVQNGLQKMVDRVGDWDMSCQPLIRLLYLADSGVEEIAQTKKLIITAFRSFQFWPNAGDGEQPTFEKIIFWSENHLFMTLGACYLFRNYMFRHFAAEDGEESGAAQARKEALQFEAEKSLETKLLKIYLRAHCCAEFDGMYEVNSCVYLPYSLNALWNLYDFAYDEEIKILAGVVIDRIVEQILTCTTSLGVVNLSAAGRSFLRQRMRNFSHNINQFINILVGQSGDKMESSSITDALLTTTWRPNFEVVKVILHTSTSYCISSYTECTPSNPITHPSPPLPLSPSPPLTPLSPISIYHTHRTPGCWTEHASPYIWATLGRPHASCTRH